MTTNTLVAAGGALRYLIPTSSVLGATWTQTGFNDSTWATGASGVGYQVTLPGFAVTNFKASITVDSLSTAQSVVANPAQQLAVIRKTRR